jgi:queuine tRNA-ribosyltransferase
VREAARAGQWEIERAMRLSLRWAERSKRAFEGTPPGRALFGIVQGGANTQLRAESARALVAMDFHGYAVGGLAVGEPQEVMLQMLEATVPHLPADRPRYLMGVGEPDDILHAVERGIDMFDCVLPTRSGRHALAYTRFGKLNLKNAKHAENPAPLDAQSECPASRDYARAYLHHLVKADEILAAMLLSWNNVAYYQSLMAGIREAIEVGRFKDFAAETRAGWEKDD